MCIFVVNDIFYSNSLAGASFFCIFGRINSNDGAYRNDPFLVFFMEYFDLKWYNNCLCLCPHKKKMLYAWTLFTSQKWYHLTLTKCRAFMTISSFMCLHSLVRNWIEREKPTKCVLKSPLHTYFNNQICK